jgi:hypothetical protein
MAPANLAPNAPRQELPRTNVVPVPAAWGALPLPDAARTNRLVAPNPGRPNLQNERLAPVAPGRPPVVQNQRTPAAVRAQSIASEGCCDAAPKTDATQAATAAEAVSAQSAEVLMARYRIPSPSSLGSSAGRKTGQV